MKIPTLLICLVLLSSCFHVYFDQVQPKNGILLNEIPEELQGTWIDKGDTIRLLDKCLKVIEVKRDSLQRVIEIKPFEMCLSDSIILQKAGDYYVANMRSSEGWEVLIVDRNEQDDLYWYYPSTAPYFGKGPGLKVSRIDKTYATKLKRNSLMKEVKPLFKKSLRENKKVTDVKAVYYSGQFKIKHIKRVIRPENIFWIFNADGTVAEK